MAQHICVLLLALRSAVNDLVCQQVSQASASETLRVRTAIGPPASVLRLDAWSIELQVL